jgi:hypothetical protein
LPATPRRGIGRGLCAVTPLATCAVDAPVAGKLLLGGFEGGISDVNGGGGRDYLALLLSRLCGCPRFVAFDEKISMKNVPSFQGLFAGIFASASQCVEPALRLSCGSTNEMVVVRSAVF